MRWRIRYETTDWFSCWSEKVFFVIFNVLIFKLYLSADEIDANLNLTIDDIYKPGDQSLKLNIKNPSKQLVQKFEDFHNKNERRQICAANKVRLNLII